LLLYSVQSIWRRNICTNLQECTYEIKGRFSTFWKRIQQLDSKFKVIFFCRSLIYLCSYLFVYLFIIYLFINTSRSLCISAFLGNVVLVLRYLYICIFVYFAGDYLSYLNSFYWIRGIKNIWHLSFIVLFLINQNWKPLINST
jgi:hypothetical protein